MIIATIARRPSDAREFYEGEREQRRTRTVLGETGCPLEDTKEAVAELVSAAEARLQIRAQAVHALEEAHEQR
jgi:hypothetical protein